MSGVGYVDTSGGTGEKSDCSRETVPHVDCFGSIRFNILKRGKKMSLSIYPTCPIGAGISIAPVCLLEATNTSNMEYGGRSSRVFQESDGSIHVREKALAEVVGERILRPLIDKIYCVGSNFFSAVTKLMVWTGNKVIEKTEFIKFGDKRISESAVIAIYMNLEALYKEDKDGKARAALSILCSEYADQYNPKSKVKVIETLNKYHLIDENGRVHSDICAVHERYMEILHRQSKCEKENMADEYYEYYGCK